MSDNRGVSDSTTGNPRPDLDRPEPLKPTQVSIRRAPKLGVFLILGAMLGLIVTLFLTGLYPTEAGVGFATLFGYFALYGVPAGVVLGAIVGLIFDRISRRNAGTVTVQHEVVEGPPLEGELED